MEIERNAFYHMLSSMRIVDGLPMDLYSRATIEEICGHSFGHYGFRLSQVFEPAVLREVAWLGAGSPGEPATFDPAPDSPARFLCERLERLPELPCVEQVNLASALVALSRFAMAERVLDAAAGTSETVRDRFEVETLRFVIENRLGRTEAMTRCYGALRGLIESGQVPDIRALDAAAQAVVWQMKKGFLPDAEWGFFLALGHRLAASSEIGGGSRSSWHRAVAMIPAREKDSRGTSREMDCARAAAEETPRTNEFAYERHFMKTYHESALKQHMYVTGDETLAQEAGRALIQLDPAWPLSYAELAEAQLHFGHVYSAARLFEKAGLMGPPYAAMNLYRAADAYRRAGDQANAQAIAGRLEGWLPPRATFEDSLPVGAAP
jgi:tetratricopeptide (TPR) repeat protein